MDNYKAIYRTILMLLIGGTMGFSPSVINRLRYLSHRHQQLVTPFPTTHQTLAPSSESFSSRRKYYLKPHLPEGVLSENRKTIKDGIRNYTPLILLIWSRSAWAVTTKSLAASSPAATLGLKQLLWASLLVTISGGITLWHRGLGHLAKQILWGCARCTIQLYILGAIILERLLGASHPAIVLSWVVGVGFVAAKQSYSRLEYTYDSLYFHLLISVLTSTLFVLGFSLSTSMLGDTLVPWFSPRAVIPVSGMIFGNAVQSTSLATKSLTREFVQQRAALELRLARGASVQEALQPVIRTSLSDALTPNINALAVAGTVQIPGMMTGNILAGQSPEQAAAYQILILFMTASTACINVQLMTRQVSHQLVDFAGARLNIDRLKRKGETQGKRKGVRKLFTWDTGVKGHAMPDADAPPLAKPMVKDFGRYVTFTPPTLTVQNLDVVRAGQQVSLTVGSGSRVGITGPSGSGKTQILRTIAGLEPVQSDLALKLFDVGLKDLSWPEWRRSVCWVSQDRPTLLGTPNDLFQELIGYHSRRKEVLPYLSPQEIANEWNLDPKALDRPWATLSGGEAQRASLAISLALRPQVLLLDEATAGLDLASQLLVEKTLLDSRIPIVMVTHSREQLLRFCTHHLELS